MASRRYLPETIEQGWMAFAGEPLWVGGKRLSSRVFNLRVGLPLLLLALTEGTSLVLAPRLARWLGSGPLGFAVNLGPEPTRSATIFFASLALLALVAVGLYSMRQRCNAIGVAIRVTLAITWAVAMSAVLYNFFPAVGMGRRILLATAIISIALCLLVRILFDRLFRGGFFKRRVLIFGAGRHAATLMKLRRRTDTHGFMLVGFIAAEGDEVAVPAERLMRRPPDLLHWAKQNRIDEIVLAMDDRRIEFPMTELLQCRLAGIDVLELASFLERETGKVRFDVLHPSWIIFSNGFRDSPFQQGLGRAFDVLVSTSLLIPALPLMLLTALAIRIEDGWHAPVLYRQRRVGRHGEPFEVLKFRSMQVDAETNGAVWATPNDPRVTKVGAFIRLSRIDELPQLINVLRNDMSFVGPRPERPEFVEILSERLPFYRSRHTVKPGITGWAQLCYPYGASDTDALEKLQYDLFYVKNRNLLFDLAIMVQTVEVVLWQKGAR